MSVDRVCRLAWPADDVVELCQCPTRPAISFQPTAPTATATATATATSAALPSQNCCSPSKLYETNSIAAVAGLRVCWGGLAAAGSPGIGEREREDEELVRELSAGCCAVSGSSGREGG